jgi:hypothetical protein
MVVSAGWWFGLREGERRDQRDAGDESERSGVADDA